MRPDRRDPRQEDPEFVRHLGTVSPGWGKQYAALWQAWRSLPVWGRWAVAGLLLVAAVWSRLT